MTDKGDYQVPSWDGTARTWRRYTREVSWYFRATPVSKRRYVATKLLAKLSGAARLLAMSWSDMFLDEYNGTRTLLQRLAASPLVRQSIPNASAICAQYFDFRRGHNEPMTSFLVRESLGFAEFVESLVRLAEEKKGVKHEEGNFGLPDEEYEYDADSTSYGDWNRWYDDWATWPEDTQEDAAPNAEDFNPNVAAAAESGSPSGAYHRVPHEPASSPSRRSAGVQPSFTAGEPEELSELSFADSFVLGVLRGFRLLQAAGLSAEERRDILSATRGSLEFEHVNKALQTLWDEQFTGARTSSSPMTSGHQHFQELHMTEELEGENDWAWDAFYASPDPWRDWGEGGDWADGYAAETQEEKTEADDPEVKEAQKAEQMAEALATEAHRTWADAQRQTAALRRDRGFGQNPPMTGKGRGPCFVCGGPHLSRECPDRRHPSWKGQKGKGKMSYFSEYDPDMFFYEDYMMGKKGKKGKSHHWLEAQAWSKGKNPKRKGKGLSTRPPVNAYSAEHHFLGGMELQTQEHDAFSSERMQPSHGLLDCGATASAGPQLAVEQLISTILQHDHQARVEISAECPYFRFGNGRWGQALYRATITSNVSGNDREFKLFALPNPKEATLDSSSLVPILVGMDHLSGARSAMSIDFLTGLALDSYEEDPKVYRLEKNKKGHLVWTLCTSSPRVFVEPKVILESLCMRTWSTTRWKPIVCSSCHWSFSPVLLTTMLMSSAFKLRLGACFNFMPMHGNFNCLENRRSPQCS